MKNFLKEMNNEFDTEETIQKIMAVSYQNKSYLFSLNFQYHKMALSFKQEIPISLPLTIS